MTNLLKQKWNRVPLEAKVSVAYTLCSILQKCLSFITLPLFTRLLTTEQYGQYTIYSSWSGILVIFLTLNLAYGSFQTAMVKFEDKRNEYITSAQGICLLLSGLFLLIYLPFRNLWDNIFELPSFLVIVLVAEIIFNTALQLWMGKKRFEYKYKSVIAVTMLVSVCSPVIAFFLVNATSYEKGYARILGYAGVNILIGGVIFSYNIIKGKKLYNKEFWHYALSFNIPLLAYYLSQVIFNQSDRIMISHMVNTSAAAMYGVAYNLAMILTFLLNAINSSYVPWLYGKIRENKGSENKLISVMLAVIMALMIQIVIWFAPEIIIIMAGEQYGPAVYVVAPVAMSLLFLFYCQLFINVEFYFEEKKLLVYGSLMAAILNIVLNYVFIEKFGFVAAGYTTLVSYMAFAVSNYFTMKVCLRKHNRPDDLYDYKALTLVLLIFMITGFVGVAFYGNLWIRIVVALLSVCLVFVKRNGFLKILKLIKKR